MPISKRKRPVILGKDAENFFKRENDNENKLKEQVKNTMEKFRDKLNNETVD